MLRQNGLKEVYLGLASTTTKQSATSAVRVGSYNVLRELTKQNNLPNNSLVTFGTGAVAGVITVYATQPFDTIRPRRQHRRGVQDGVVGKRHQGFLERQHHASGTADIEWKDRVHCL